jgi:hypothetical protein
MTRRYPTQQQAQTLTVPCRLCGAQSGTWCRTVWTRRPGRPTTGLHVERHTDAMDDGRLPLGGAS